MKKLQHLFMIAVLGVGMMLLQACTKDNMEIPDPELPILEEARYYFESQVLTGKNKIELPSVSKINNRLVFLHIMILPMP